MLHLFTRMSFFGLFALSLASQLRAQTVHQIRMEVENGEYRFVPSTTTARPGDVLQFHVVSGGPHSVVFDARGMRPEVRAALNGAMPNRFSDLSSPLVTSKSPYEIVVPADLPDGRYAFYCLPHRAYDMAGALHVSRRR